MENTFLEHKRASMHLNIDESERIISALGGTYLAYKSIGNLARHPFTALQGLAAAGLLLYRGATGVCAIYN